MKCYEIKGLIFNSIYHSDEFINEYEKGLVLGSLEMFFNEHNFNEYFENHILSEDEYKRYFKKYLKVFYPRAHRGIKKYFENKGDFIKWK